MDNFTEQVKVGIGMHRKMKLFGFIFLLFLGIANEMKAQVFQFGLKGGLLSTEMKNNNFSFTEPPEGPNDYKFSYGCNYGASFGIFLPKRINNFFAEYGIQTEILKNTHNQKFNRKIYKDNVITEYSYEVNLYTIDIPVLLRVNTHSGIFIESGIQYSHLSMANETSGNLSQRRSFSDKNSRENYSQNNTMVIAGLGMNLCNHENIAVNIGFRGSYGINDLTLPQSSKFENYIPTHSLAYGLTVEVDYRMLKYNDTRNHMLRQMGRKKY